MWLNKLPGSRREPAGLEWRVMKKLPLVTLGGSFICLAFAVLAHLYPPALTGTELVQHLKLVDIIAIAVLITFWTAVFTVAIACFVVMVMKGPAYVADAYPVVDAEQPRKSHHRR